MKGKGRYRQTGVEAATVMQAGGDGGSGRDSSSKSEIWQMGTFSK